MGAGEIENEFINSAIKNFNDIKGKLEQNISASKNMLINILINGGLNILLKDEFNFQDLFRLFFQIIGGQNATNYISYIDSISGVFDSLPIIPNRIHKELFEKLNIGHFILNIHIKLIALSAKVVIEFGTSGLGMDNPLDSFNENDVGIVLGSVASELITQRLPNKKNNDL